jgi:DNA repair protein SbcC/Rad50
MILKKIILNNIRSYEKQEIEFPTGATLLSGDIGSGKTSILLGIEFALFGLQPGQKGSSLLRNGQETGGVILEFEVEEKQILIERTLKRGKTISQDYCAITSDGETRELSVSELKSLILNLLNYPGEFAKKQNLLYKFTVYTPQEEMKQIILEDSNTRLNTLRHVFGIDKYKTILENSSIILTKIREEKRLKEGMTLSLDNDKEILSARKLEEDSKNKDLEKIEIEFEMKKQEAQIKRQEAESISTKIEEKNQLQQEIEKTKLMILTKKDSIESNKKTLEQTSEQIRELSELKVEESQLREIEERINFFKQDSTKFSEENLNISSELSSLSMKNQGNEDTIQRLQKLELCPTCLQDVDPVYKSNVVTNIENNTTENIKKIQQLTLEKATLSKKISETILNISEAEKKLQELKILQIKSESIGEKTIYFNELTKSNDSLKGDIDLLTNQVELLNKSIFELKKYENIFEQKKKELEEAAYQEKITEIKNAELKKEIDLIKRQINELEERISRAEEIKKQHSYLIKLEDWIAKRFIPVISYIEKNVLAQLKSEFSKLFSEWFSMLVAGNFEVRLGDDFSPIIEQQDYEIDYAYLSGGERTAIALAYRLALNQVINSLMSKIKTRDLVILDEPTDGFSEQQLDKMRDVLQELDVAQLIIVSHEQKIEGFVDNVIKLKKSGNLTHKDQ